MGCVELTGTEVELDNSRGRGEGSEVRIVGWWCVVVKEGEDRFVKSVKRRRTERRKMRRKEGEEVRFNKALGGTEDDMLVHEKGR
jgi:hypothetical protein